MNNFKIALRTDMDSTPGNLYKYMGPDIVDRFLQADGTCTLKLSNLKDYNDPFEFFLTIDYNQGPDILAYYNEMISMVIESPVTCFSRSAISTPMWAHYAANSQGFVVEIDEIGLCNWLAEEKQSSADFGDIDYQDAPHPYMQGLLDMAFVRSKFRDVGFLQRAIGSAAYYTKQQCWSYEQERRLVVSDSAATVINPSLSLLYFPSEFVTAIIAGAKSTEDTREKLREIANKIGCDFYLKRFGKSTTTPFFIDQSNRTHVFSNQRIVSHDNSCEECNEPSDGPKCSWCSISDADKINAARRNSFRALHDAGILGEYIQGFDNIGRKR